MPSSRVASWAWMTIWTRSRTTLQPSKVSSVDIASPLASRAVSAKQPAPPGDCDLPAPSGKEGSEVQHEARRVLERLLDPDEEGHRLLAVDDAVVIGKRQIHHRPRDDLAAMHHRPLLDLVHAEDRRLRGIEDRRRHQRAVDTAIGDGE